MTSLLKATGAQTSQKVCHITCECTCGTHARAYFIFVLLFCCSYCSHLMFHLMHWTLEKKQSVFNIRVRYYIRVCRQQEAHDVLFWTGIAWDIKARETDPSHLERNAEGEAYGQCVDHAYRSALLKDTCSLIPPKHFSKAWDGFWWKVLNYLKRPEGETRLLERRRVVVRLRWKVKTYRFLSLLTEWSRPDLTHGIAQNHFWDIWVFIIN